MQRQLINEADKFVEDLAEEVELIELAARRPNLAELSELLSGLGELFYRCIDRRAQAEFFLEFLAPFARICFEIVEIRLLTCILAQFVDGASELKQMIKSFF